MIRIFEIAFLFWSGSKFDYLRDAIADYKNSTKFWLYMWCLKHPEYLPWLQGHQPLPFWNKAHKFLFITIKQRAYDPGKIWLCDAWHMAKSFLLLSFIGVIAALGAWIISLAFDLRWYFELPIQIILWWFLYWLEGMIFNKGYDKLK